MILTKVDMFITIFYAVLLCFREGQPLKLPETKKSLLFTFNGERPTKYFY